MERVKKRYSPGKIAAIALLSCVLLGTNAIFIWLNYRASLDTLGLELESRTDNFGAIFESIILSTAGSMQQVAMDIASEPRVTHSFLQGKIALEKEGGGAGGVETDTRRNELYLEVKDAWQQMTTDYEVRQLHFHFGPGALSYLRVHRPEKYGDRMDNLRYTIVDTNGYFTPTKGVETGRMSSGVRGVVPVFTRDELTGRRIHIGALEAGTSFTILLENLHSATKYKLAVLLRREHLKQNLWPEIFEERVKADAVGKDFLLEASTDKDISFIRDERVVSQVKKEKPVIYYKNQEPFLLLVLPFKDYHQSASQSVENIGVVLAWRSLKNEFQVIKNNFVNNILFGLLVVVLLEIILLSSWHLGAKGLKRAMQIATFKLQLTKRKLAAEIQEKNRIEKLLRQSEKQCRSMFQDNSASMLLVDPESNAIKDCNQAACIFYQYEKAELLKMRLIDLAASAEVLPEHEYKDLLLNHESFSVDHTLGSGEQCHVALYCCSLAQDGKNLVLIIVYDMSPRLFKM